MRVAREVVCCVLVFGGVVGDAIDTAAGAVHIEPFENQGVVAQIIMATFVNTGNLSIYQNQKVGIL